MNKLGAVNAILRTIGNWRASALDSSGSWPSKIYGPNEAGEAEMILDQTTEKILERGWPDNTEKGKSLTPAGSPLKIASPSNCIALRGTGKHSHRTFKLRGGFVLDCDVGSVEFATADPIVVDVITNYEFSDLSVDLQAYVLEEAKREFQRSWGGDVQKDGEISQDRDINKAAVRTFVAKGEAPLNKLDDTGPWGPANAPPAQRR